MVLLYLGIISSITKTNLTKCITKHLKFCKLRFIFQTSNRLKSYFRFQDHVPETVQLNFDYKFKCASFLFQLPITGKTTDI